jgi:dihydrodipicolinate synthase/N-acetylneuraminate lyase
MAYKLELHGILPAMLTPFTEDGSAIDTEALAALTRRLIDAGVGGLIPGGSTGEFTALTHDERKLLHETVIQAAEGRVPVIPQTGALTAAEAVKLTRHAEQAGAAGVMVVPPFYDGLTYEELKAYFTEVAGSVSIPVMVYHIPSATGQNLSAEELAGLGDIPGVDSVKDSGGDAAALTAGLLLNNDRLQVANGWDHLTFLGLATGAKSSVWGAANIFPEEAVELYETVAVRGDLKAGRELWARLFPIVLFLEEKSYGPRVKAATRLTGVQVGQPRRPFLPIPAEDEATLKELLSAAGIGVRELVSAS